MRVTYVLDAPSLGGGVKVVFQHARILLAAGYAVSVLGRGPKPGWIGFGGHYVDYTQRMPTLPTQDLVVGTYWTTIDVARALGTGPVAHFCQGYEGALSHLAAFHSRIDAVYGLPLPTIVVSPHLAPLLYERFGRVSRVAPPVVDPAFRPAFRVGPRREPRVFITGIFEADVKDIRTAIGAVCHLRDSGRRCRVTRVSTVPYGADELRLLQSDRYLCGVSPDEVARALRRMDLLLFTSRSGEGFGLPVLEAMASGVPVVASDIPSLAPLRSAIATAPAGDAPAFAAAAGAILDNRRLWRRYRQSGLVAARRYLAEVVGPEVISTITWAARHAVETRPA